MQRSDGCLKKHRYRLKELKGIKWVPLNESNEPSISSIREDSKLGFPGADEEGRD
jgi:hypothetical protein